MFRHSAESIRESSRKMFTSQAEKTTWDNKAELEHKHNDMYYTKEEIDSKVDKATLIQKDVKAVYQNTEKGIIRIQEIYGNTEQHAEKLTRILSVGEKVGEGQYKVVVKAVNNKKNLYNHEEHLKRIKNVKGVIITENGITLDSTQNSNIMSDVSATLTAPSLTDYPFKEKTSYTIKYNGTQHDDILRARITVYYTDNTQQFPNNINGECVLVSDPNKTIRKVMYHWNTQNGNGKTSIEDVMIYESSLGLDFNDKTHECNKLEIILPTPLEMVHTRYRDRLYKDVDGVWKIEKHVNTEYIPTINWHEASEAMHTADNVLYNSHQSQLNIAPDVGYFISPEFVHQGDLWNAPDKEGFALHTNTSLQLRFNKSKIANVDDLRAWIRNTKPTFKYVLKEPTIMPLNEPIPDTLVCPGGDVTVYIGTMGVYNTNGGNGLSCTIPVSKKSTVESINDNITSQRERIKKVNMLSSTTNLTLDMPNSMGKMVTLETKKGYIDDIVIEGRTVKNILPNSPDMWSLKNATIDGNGAITLYHGNSVNEYYATTRLMNTQFELNTKYKLVIDIIDNPSQQYLGISEYYTRLEDGRIDVIYSAFKYTDNTNTQLLCKDPGRYVFDITSISKLPVNQKASRSIYFCIWNENGSGITTDKLNRLKFRVGIFKDDGSFNYNTFALTGNSELLSVGSGNENGPEGIELFSRKTNNNLIPPLSTVKWYKSGYTYDMVFRADDNYPDLEMLDLKDNYFEFKSSRNTFGYNIIVRVKPNTKYILKGDLVKCERSVEEGSDMAKYTIRKLSHKSEFNKGPNYVTDFNHSNATVRPMYMKNTGLDEGHTFTTNHNTQYVVVGIASPYKWSLSDDPAYGVMTIGVENFGLYEVDSMEKLDLSNPKCSEEYTTRVLDNEGKDIVLRGLPNGVVDRIFKKDGTYYYTKNIDIMNIDGKEDWSLEGGTYESPDVVVVKVPMYNNPKFSEIKNGREVLCDRLPTRDYGKNKEAIFAYVSNTNLIVGVSKVRLTLEGFTNDLDGVKEWLNKYPLTVMYERVNPITVPINNIAIPTHVGKTDFCINSASVSPIFKAKVSSHIGTTVSSLIDKVEYVEKEVNTINTANLLSSSLLIDNKAKINELINSSNTK